MVYLLFLLDVLGYAYGSLLLWAAVPSGSYVHDLIFVNVAVNVFA